MSRQPRPTAAPGYAGAPISGNRYDKAPGPAGDSDEAGSVVGANASDSEAGPDVAGASAWPCLRACLLIVLIVTVANVWKLGFGLDSDPLLHRSGLAATREPAPLGGYHTIDPNDGFTLQALGIAAGDQWLDGDVPYWNRYEGVGTPLAGEMQSMALSPVVMLYQLPHGFLFAQILLESVAGIATLLFLRRLGIGRLVGFGAGLAYAFNGTFAWLTNAAMNPVAYLPILLLGIELARDSMTRRRRGGWVLIAVGVSGSLYAGFPETAYINGLFALGWCVVRCAGLDRASIAAFGQKLIAGALAGVLLAAPIIVAFLDYLRHADVGGHAGGFATRNLPSTSISGLFLPYIYGPISAFSGSTTSPNLGGFWSSIGGYLSAIQLFLVVATLGMRRLRPMHIAFGIWFLIYVSKTYRTNPLTELVMKAVNMFPGIDQLAYFRYSQPSVAMGLLILAAFGAQGIASGQIPRQRIMVSSVVSAFVLLAMAWYARNETRYFVSASHYQRFFVGSILFALAGVGAAAILTVVPREKWRATGLAILMGAEACALYVVPQLSTTRVSDLDTAPVDFLRANLGLQRFYTLGPIVPNYGSVFGVASINQNDVPVSDAWGKYILAHLDANTIPHAFVGNFRADPAGPSAVDELVRNLASYGEVATRYVVSWSDPATSERLVDAGLAAVYDDGNVAIHEIASASEYFDISDGACSLDATSWQRVEVDCERPSTLIRRELADPGWTASIDGDNVRISTTNEIFQRVDVPAGRSVIGFEYAPPRIGLAWLGALGAALWIAVSSVLQRRTRLRVGPDPLDQAS